MYTHIVHTMSRKRALLNCPLCQFDTTPNTTSFVSPFSRTGTQTHQLGILDSTSRKTTPFSACIVHTCTCMHACTHMCCVCARVLCTCIERQTGQ